MALGEAYGGQRRLAFKLTTPDPTALFAIQQRCSL